MIPVQVTLVNNDGEEWVAGPFNQGVVIKQFDRTAPLTIYDVAGEIGSNAIARYLHPVGWVLEGAARQGFFEHVFVQAVALTDREQADLRADMHHASTAGHQALDKLGVPR